jgi:hypothetical protein
MATSRRMASERIPRVRILLIPRPASIQAQPQVEDKGESARKQSAALRAQGQIGLRRLAIFRNGSLSAPAR